MSQINGIEIAEEIGRRISRIGSFRDCSLGGGYAGALLLFDALYKYTKNRFWEQSLDETLSAALAILPIDASLYSGSAGLLGVLAIVRRRRYDLVLRELCGALESYVGRSVLVSQLSYGYQYDLISGFTGLGIALFASRSHAYEHLRLKVFDAMREFSPTQLFALSDIEGRSVRINRSVSHGLAGLLTMLALGDRNEASANGIKRLGQEIMAIDPGVHNVGSWCYGELNICGAVLFAANRYGFGELHEAARERVLSMMELVHVPWQESGLCHGSYGAAFVLRRLRQYIKDDRLGILEQKLLSRSTSAYYPEAPFGYRARDSKGVPIDAPGFLTGAVGCALGAIAADICALPAWCTLLAMPPDNLLE